MKNIGIIGLGLIGGSIAKSLKARADVNIVAFNRSEGSIKEAIAEGVISEGSTEDMSIFSDCDIIFICTPVDKIISYVERLRPYIKDGFLITDAGSTKGEICDKMEKFVDIAFIGGHPMAGSEKTSYLAATEYLYENAYYILTPLNNVKDTQINMLVELVTTIGAIPIVVSPKEHDYIVSAISHVPHVISAALVNMVKKLDNDKEYMHTLAAGGFKDITRIASSSPEMWSAICAENKEEILRVIGEYKAIISDFEDKLIEDKYEEIYSFFDKSREYRNSFADNRRSAIVKYYELYVDIIDKPGSIGTVASLLSDNNINIKNIGIVNNREHSGGVLQILFESEEDKLKSISLFESLDYTIYVK